MITPKVDPVLGGIVGVLWVDEFRDWWYIAYPDGTVYDGRFKSFRTALNSLNRLRKAAGLTKIVIGGKTHG